MVHSSASGVPMSFAAHEPAIIAACTEHEQKNLWRIDDYRRCIPFVIQTTKYFVKFGDSSRFSSEVTTQTTVASFARGDPSAPRIPAVYHSFQHGCLTYAIMEFIETIEVPMDVFVHKVATAVLWLHRQPVPPGVDLGPLRPGRAAHKVFKDLYAPLPFTSGVALERYLNKGLSAMQRLNPDLAAIHIAGEPLVLTQSDMNPGNFAVDTTGRPVVFDFDMIGWLPTSLANYTLLKTTSFAADVSVHVLGSDRDSIASSSNLVSMGAVRVRLVTGFGPTLGLDKDGNPRT